MKILKEEAATGSRLLMINYITRAYTKFPDSRNDIESAFRKATRTPWDDSATPPENLSKVPTEDIRYIHDEINPKYLGEGEPGEQPPSKGVIDFSFSVKANGKGFDIITNRDVLNPRVVRSGSSIEGVKEFITDWVENELG